MPYVEDRALLLSRSLTGTDRFCRRILAPAQTAGAKHRAGPLGPRSGRFLGGNPHSVKPRVEPPLDQPEGGRAWPAGGENRHGRSELIAALAGAQKLGDPQRDG